MLYPFLAEIAKFISPVWLLDKFFQHFRFVFRDSILVEFIEKYFYGITVKIWVQFLGQGILEIFTEKGNFLQRIIMRLIKLF